MSHTDDFKHLELKLKDIEVATNNFRDKPIGTGGFGAVYKGELLLPVGQRMVAFKRLNRKYGQGDVEFWKEIMMLTELKHEHLASLLRFCRKGNERILAYEYVPRGSLDEYLDKASLTWVQRLNICVGTARAIAYLHDPKKTQQRVIHRDIKCSNILLDDNWAAKLSDFGLAKLGPANQARSYLVSNVVGTPGYCDPEYFATGILSKECDVYSFGVVLFEVMCGRLCCEYDKGRMKCIFVYEWKKCFHEDRLHDIIFPDIMQQIKPESLSTFATIANRCVDRDPKKRPSMVEVVKDLEIALHNHHHHHQQQSSKQGITNVVKTPTLTSYNSEQDLANVVTPATSYRIMMEEFRMLELRLDDVQRATNKFSEKNLIGHGGIGYVYKGVLSLPGGQSTVGYCDKGDEIILVYKYASWGSLVTHLSEPALTWTQRLKISIRVAYAINYLHNPPSTQTGVVHGRIRSSNILLDENWATKVSDFGHTQIKEPDAFSTVFPSGVFYSPGYCDPMYVRS